MKKKQRVRARSIPIAEEVKDKNIRFRVTSKEFESIYEAALKKESSVSLFIMECIRPHIKDSL
jgi:uncharacterized protein (DUF1778 family)